MKTRLFAILALCMLLVAAGCTSSEEPTPTPAIPDPMPDVTAIPESPDVSPDNSSTAAPSEAPTPTDDGMSGDLTGEGMGNTEATIPDFAEGKEVAADDVPHIQTALMGHVEGANIQRITHGTREGNQVYCVEYTDKDGQVAMAYMMPDGTLIEDDGTTDSSLSTPETPITP